MQATFVDRGQQHLAETVAEFDADPTVAGLIVFVAGADDDITPADVVDAAVDISTPLVGGVFPELIHGGEKFNSGAVVTGLSVKPTVTAVSDVSNAETTVHEQLDPTLIEQGHETAFVFIDAHTDAVSSVIQGLFSTYGVEMNFVGGGAGTLDGAGDTALFTGDGLVEDGVVIATLPISSGLGVRHGWQEFAGPFRVTDADGRLLRTLDGEPAFDVYRRALGMDTQEIPSPDEFFQIAKANPFGIARLDAEHIVRDPFRVREDRAIECFGSLPDGEFVHILQGDEQTLIDSAGAAYDDAKTASPDGTTLFFDCISRVLYLEDRFESELQAVGGDREPAAGALTIGEIANDGYGHLEYYNKTAVALRLPDA